MYKYLVYLITAMWLFSCGEGTVEFEDNLYEPKLAIEAILISGKTPERIYVWRNFPLDTDFRSFTPVLPNAEVFIIDLDNNVRRELTYDETTASFYSEDDQWVIEPLHSYRLEVFATVDGKDLKTTGETTVPADGLQIVDINHDSLSYRQPDGHGGYVDFELTFERSPSSSMYVATVEALAADTSTFVYDNPFFEAEPDEVLDDLEDYRYAFEWLQDVPMSPGQTDMQLFWWDFWFYGSYRILLYAADEHYSNYIKTYGDVQEPDGNFHAPAINLDQDGIGVFGSAAVDTIFVAVGR